MATDEARGLSGSETNLMGSRRAIEGAAKVRVGIKGKNGGDTMSDARGELVGRIEKTE